MRFKKVAKEKSQLGIEFHYLQKDDKQVILFNSKVKEFVMECRNKKKVLTITLRNTSLRKAKELAKELLLNDLDVTKCGYKKRSS